MNLKSQVMNCLQYRTELTTAKKREELSDVAIAHLKACPECKALTQSYGWFLDFVNAEKKIKVSPFITTRIMSSIETDKADPVRQIIPWLRVLAFMLTMTIGFTFAYLSDKRQSEIADQMLTNYINVENSAFEIDKLWFEEMSSDNNYY
jgi:hypothetical protein